MSLSPEAIQKFRAFEQAFWDDILNLIEPHCGGRIALMHALVNAYQLAATGAMEEKLSGTPNGILWKLIFQVIKEELGISGAVKEQVMDRLTQFQKEIQLLKETLS